jgi:hypothetical protein
MNFEVYQMAFNSYSVRFSVFVQVPLPYFRKEFMQKYLQLAKGQLISNSEQILSQADESFGLVHVFSIETALLNWFSQTYPLVEIQYTPICQIVLEVAKAESRSSLRCMFMSKKTL